MFKVENYDSSEFSAESFFQKESLPLAKYNQEVIEPMFARFQKDKLEALRYYTNKFQRHIPKKWVLEQEDLLQSYERCTAEKDFLWETIQGACKNIYKFHKKQKLKNIQTKVNGNTLGMKFEPMERVALYVPGGNALYPSSVLMGVIPAKIAGVKDITVVTPSSQKNDKVVPEIIQATAYYCGANRVLQAGGAQGIFGVALGIPELNLKPVDFIYGPGNVYVSCAKNFVSSQNFCGIDTFAGPSEVFIIADETASPEYLAYDMLAQAEHDTDAVCILACSSKKMAEQAVEKLRYVIEGEIERNSDAKRFPNATIAKESLYNHAKILYSSSLDKIINLANQFAPEHLEIHTKNPKGVLKKIHSAGSVFLGDYSPVAVGDYYSGTNHILPTNGAARYSSGISVHSFYKRITYQKCSRSSINKMKEKIWLFSRYECLLYHGLSVKKRK